MDMVKSNNKILSFKLTKSEAFAVSFDSDSKNFLLDISKGRISAEFYYDFRECPLVLSGECEPGSEIRIILMPYRIELWVDGKICDEEWPCGELRYHIGDEIISNLTISVNEYFPKEETLPSVIGTIKNAEGWKPSEHVFVGDCMPYTDRNRYHVLYLKDRHHHKSKWGLGAHQWEHISTKDFKTWDIHPMAVKIDEQQEGSICTGSFIRAEELCYLYYTVRMADGSPAKISRSISHDGYHFEKDRNFSFTLSKKYKSEVARDPKVVMDDEGMYHMIITTSLVKENCGCLAHLISSDLDSWVEMDQPLLVTEDEPECPDYFKYNDRYYLVYSLKGRGYYQYSKKPFSEWLTPKNPIIPCHSVPKAAIFEEKIIFAGFQRCNGYGGTMTFQYATVDKEGELVFDFIP